MNQEMTFRIIAKLYASGCLTEHQLNLIVSENPDRKTFIEVKARWFKSTGEVRRHK